MKKRLRLIFFLALFILAALNLHVFYLRAQELTQDKNTGDNISKSINKSELINENVNNINIQKQSFLNRFYLGVIPVFIALLIILDFFYFKILRKYFFDKPISFFRSSADKIVSLNAESFMNKNFYRLDSESSLLDSIEFFVSNNVNSIVITNKNKAVGILTKKDIITCLEKLSFESFNSTKIKSIIKKDFISLDPKEPLDTIINKLMNTKKDVVIFEDKGKIKGTVDYFDILNVFGNIKLIVENSSIAKNIMNTKVTSVDSNTSVADLKKTLIDKESDYAIIKKDEKPVGIVTIKDILGSILKNLDLKKIYVDNIMSTRLVSLNSWTSLHDALEIFLEKRFNQIPVIEKEKIIGIVSTLEISKAYYSLLSELKKIDDSSSVEFEDKE
jgi:predicted transcriptional regulator